MKVQRDRLLPPMAQSYEQQGISTDNINMGIDYCNFSLLAGTSAVLVTMIIMLEGKGQAGLMNALRVKLAIASNIRGLYMFLF